VWYALIVVVSNASELHGYTVRALYRAFQTSAEQVLIYSLTKSMHIGYLLDFNLFI
jgi:AP-1 complex subunit gamma-1